MRSSISDAQGYRLVEMLCGKFGWYLLSARELVSLLAQFFRVLRTWQLSPEFPGDALQSLAGNSVLSVVARYRGSCELAEDPLHCGPYQRYYHATELTMS